MMLQAMLTHCK